MGVLTAGGLSLAYETWGERSALAPLVLLHGLGGNRLHWAGVGPLLAQATGRRIIALDLPGHGDSEGLGDVSLAEAADVLAAARGPLGAWRPVWVGHDIGGQLIGALAARHPAAVTGLVLLDPGLPDAGSGWLKALRSSPLGELRKELGPFENREAARSAARRLRQYQPWGPLQEQAFLAGQKVLMDGSVTARLRPEAFDAYVAAAGWGDVGAVEAPARVIWPAESAIGRGEREKLHRAWPALQAAQVAGHHWAMLSHPAEVAGAIAAFVADIEAAG